MQDSEQGGALGRKVAGNPEDFHDRDSEEDSHDLNDCDPRPFRPPAKNRVLLVLFLLVGLILLTVVPPLVNVNRFRRQIAASIGASLGRPVRLKSVTLSLLPMPGFLLEDLVVAEDPAFGSEPVIRAHSVRVTLRLRSFWRHRVEFSKISLDEPSVNLVHLPDGRWNVQSILLQASRMQVAPTAQKGAGDAPRFPYIEATNARVNLKMGLEKMPLSLTEANFALWLPEPQQWRLRLDARPSRTDTAATDTGTLHVEGTLGKAPVLQLVPIDLQAKWSEAPLGSVSRVLLGEDAGLRGTMTLQANVRGTIGDNLVESRLRLSGVRRAEFVPASMLEVDLSCKAQVFAVFAGLRDVQCGSPADGSRFQMTATVPELRHPQTAVGSLKMKNVPVESLLELLRAASSRISPLVQASGSVDGELAYDQSSVPTGHPAGTKRGLLPKLAGPMTTRHAVDGVRHAEFTISKARITLGGDNAVLIDDDLSGGLAANEIEVQPVALHLGASMPALLEAHINQQGYGLNLSGPILRSRLEELARAFPQFGDGLEQVLPVAATSPPNVGSKGSISAEATLRVDLRSFRPWGAAQTWTSAVPPRPARHSHRSRRTHS